MSQPEYDFRERCKELEEELADDREVFREEIARLRKQVEAAKKIINETLAEPPYESDGDGDEYWRGCHNEARNMAVRFQSALELK